MTIRTDNMWQMYEASGDPARQNCLAELELWLDEVGARKEQQRLRNELRGTDWTHALSARLELFLHHYFRDTSWSVTWHPTLVGTTSHPDLKCQKGSSLMYVEARISDREAQFQQQEVFCRLLQERLEAEERTCHITFFLTTSPPPAPIRERVIDESIVRVRALLSNHGAEATECDEEFRIGGSRYGIHFSSSTPALNSGHPVVLYSVGGFSGIEGKLKSNILEKADKYGKPGAPFVICVWGIDYPGIRDEIGALYGTEVLSWLSDPIGNMVGPMEPRRQPDGIFTWADERGGSTYGQVSAVAFYQHRFHADYQEHRLRVYHNPRADHALAKEVFDEYHQPIPYPSGYMKWLPDDPEDER